MYRSDIELVDKHKKFFSMQTNLLNCTEESMYQKIHLLERVKVSFSFCQIPPVLIRS